MKTLIVDDEKNARLAIRGIIEENFSTLHIVGEAKDVPEAVKMVRKLEPELIFLDISMPGYSGLELFKFFDEEELNFKVVFVTAYSEYAINAFELSAVDYILKPIQISAIERAINKVYKNYSENIKALQTHFEGEKPQKLALHTGDGIIFMEFKDIIYLKADGSYTHFITENHSKITVSKRLAEFEKLEKMGAFLRIHRSHIINYNRISKIIKQDGGFVVMDNTDELSISATYKSILLDKFKQHKL
jgi:two-component system LytT family response regulator